MGFAEQDRLFYGMLARLLTLTLVLPGNGCGSINGRVPTQPGGGNMASVTAPPLGTPTVAEWASIAFGGMDEAGTQARVSAGTRGIESAFFMEVFGRLARETRDVGPVVRMAARNWVLRDKTAAAKVVSEVWARECCLRRSFLVEALEGVRLGMDGARPGIGGSVEDASTALKLAELSEHPDDGVARAARVLESRFSMGAAPDDAANGKP